MKLIERYIFRKAGIATLAILLSLAGVVWIVQALGKIDIITAKGQSLQSYFMATTLVIPMLFLAVIPVALLLGTVATVNAMNSNSELVVINASGASNRVVLKPFLVLALICSLFTGFVGHFVIAWSLTSLKSYKREMAADLVSVLVKEGDFTEVEKGLTIHIARRLPDGRLGGILISDDRTPEQQQVFLAREGALSRTGTEAILYLHDGEILQKDLSDNSSSVIRYDSYAFDLDTLSAKDNTSFKRRPKERSTPELLFPDPDDSFYKRQPELYTSEIHQRFSEMLWPFAYVMVILAFCGQARSSRQGYGSAIASGMILLMALRGAAFSAASSIKANETMAVYLYVIPIAAMAYASYYLYQNRQIGVPRRLQPVLERASLRGEAWLKAQNDRYLAWRRKVAGVAS